MGSTSIITDATFSTLMEDTDYFPYGGEVSSDSTDSNHYKFTGKERDSETGLDYFGARYYGSNMGRWMSPDWAAAPTAVPYAQFGDPQTLNLYGYLRNNPLAHADDDGHCGPLCTGLIGAAVGGVIGGGVEAYRQYKQSGHITNWRSVGANAAGGAVAGAIAGATLGTATFISAGYGTTAAITGGSNMIGGGVTRALNGQKVVDAKAAFTDAAAGAAGGAVGKFVGTQAVKAIVVNPAAQQATMSTANPSAYETVYTVVGNRTMSDVQAVTNVAGSVAGSVATVQATNTLTGNTQPQQQTPPPPPPQDKDKVRQQ